MKKLWLLLNIIILNNCFAYDNQTEVKRSLLMWAAAGSGMFYVFGLFSLGRALKTVKDVRNKKATWQDESTWDGKESVTLRRRTVYDTMFGSLFTLVGTGAGAIWIRNFMLRQKPIMIFNDQGFTYEDESYKWQDMQSYYRNIIRRGDSTDEYVFVKMKGGRSVCIDMSLVALSYEKLKILIDLYDKKNQFLYADFDFSQMDDTDNKSVIRIFDNLASKVDNHEIIHWYDILGVQVTASEKDINDAFKTLSRRYHPDKNQYNPFAGKVMSIVNNAKDYVTRVKRAENDQALKALSEEFDNIYRDPV